MMQCPRCISNSLMLKKYEELLSLYVNDGIKKEEDLVELFQYLIDTDKIHHMSEQMRKTANYMIMEGFCYYVPGEENH